MKVFSTVCRILLGLVFVLSGLNGFVRFGHAPAFSTALAREYMVLMLATPYGHILFGIQLICGVLLLADLFVPAVLVVLAAYLFNIYMFHIFLEPGKLALVLLLTVLWVGLFFRYREAFHPLLRARNSFRSGEEAR